LSGGGDNIAARTDGARGRPPGPPGYGIYVYIQHPIPLEAAEWHAYILIARRLNGFAHLGPAPSMERHSDISLHMEDVT